MPRTTGELPDAQRIDEIPLEQGLDEVAAAVDLDLAAFLGLELRDLLGDVALEQAGVAPVDPIERPRGANFGRVLSAVAISSAGSVD